MNIKQLLSANTQWHGDFVITCNVCAVLVRQGYPPPDVLLWGKKPKNKQ